MNISYYESIRDLDRTDLINFLGETNYPSHFHKKIEITYVLKGTCNTVINGQSFHAEKDDIIFVPEYFAHSYSTSEDACRYILCPVSELILEFTAAVGSKNLMGVLSNKEFNRTKILPILDDLFHLYKNDVLNDKAQILLYQGYVNILLGHFLQEYSHLLIPAEKKTNLISNIFRFIDSHYTETITLEMLSKEFNYDKFYISKLINSTLHINLKSYINNIRILHFVRQYQLDPKQNITTLVFNLGFDSTTSFYRAFKKEYGCNPKDFFKNA